MDNTRGLWRGKRLDNGDWAEGDLTRYSADMSYITVDLIENEVYQVDGNTLGECTGLRDKNGELIFEGDILKRLNTKQTIIYTVNWCEECAMFVMPCITHEQLESDFTVFAGDDFEIIGNIHDNPDLLTLNKS